MPRFPYTRISNPFRPGFLQFKNCPLLTVGLLADSGAMLKSKAYIDTGAQACLFDNSFAGLLGIRDYKNTKAPSDRVPLSGIGGKQPENVAYFHDMKLVIFKNERRFKLDNALQVVETKIGFLERTISFSGILGVYGFLDRFSFKANIPEGYFEIEPLLKS